MRRTPALSQHNSYNWAAPCCGLASSPVTDACMHACGGGWVDEWNVIYLRACARRWAPRTRVSDRARGPPQAHTGWRRRLLDRHRHQAHAGVGASPILVIDTGLMFVWYIPCGVLSIASNERSAAAQRCRRRATASADHSASADATAALGGSHCRMSSSPCLWLGAVQMDEQGLVCMRLEGNVRTGGNWHVVSHSHL